MLFVKVERISSDPRLRSALVRQHRSRLSITELGRCANARGILRDFVTLYPHTLTGYSAIGSVYEGLANTLGFP